MHAARFAGVWIASSIAALTALWGAEAPLNPATLGLCQWNPHSDVAPCLQAAIDMAAPRNQPIIIPDGVWRVSPRDSACERNHLGRREPRGDSNA